MKIGSAVAFGFGGFAIAFVSALGPIRLPILGPLAPWQLVMIVTGLPGLLVALLAFTFAEPKARAPAKESRVHRVPGRTNVREFLKQHGLLLALMAVGFSSVSVCAFALSSWVPTYMSRQFGWSALRYGSILSLINLSAAASMILKGWIVDRLYSRGMQDAHLRFYSWLLIAAVPAGVLLFAVDSPFAFLTLYTFIQLIAIQYLVYMAATVQLFVPGDLRGRTTGAFIASVTVFGYGLGPTGIGFLTDFVFRSETQLRWSLMMMTNITLPLACLAVLAALRVLNRRVIGAAHLAWR
jgi:MFS family permease